nr:unnamed protein product [Callosobruchus analis]
MFSCIVFFVIIQIAFLTYIEMDEQDKEFDVSLYLSRITFDQLQKSPSLNKEAEYIVCKWATTNSLDRFSLRATLHNYNMVPTDLTDLELFLHDAELRDLQRNVPVRKKIKQLFKPRRGQMTKDEFDAEADRLYKWMTILRDIIQRVDIAYCVTMYSQLIEKLNVLSLRLALNAVITFYMEGKLWDVDFNCMDLISRCLNRLPDAEVGFNDILRYMKIGSTTKPQHSRHIMVVLYEVVKLIEWRSVPPESVDNFMKKLLDMLQCNSEYKIPTRFNCLALRKGIRMCICNMIEVLWKKRLVKLPNQSPSIQRTFSNLARMLAAQYRKRTSRPFSEKGLMPLIFGLFFCREPSLNVLAMTIWRSLLDADNTGHIFQCPRVYFEDALYEIPYCRVHYEDKAFFKSVQRFIFESIVYGIASSTDREILCCYHETIALTMVTVRCNAAASCFVAVGMAVQEYAFTITKSQLVRSHHLHAFVLSIMTLVCYVFHAKIFYKYVTSVMQNRAEWAPHLNPPIQKSYKYAAHHILWNRPDLFFEDWEVKHGMWKCFRVKHLDSQCKLPEDEIKM